MANPFLRATPDKYLKEVEILKAKVVSLEQNYALKLKSKWKTMATGCHTCATKISQLNDSVHV